MKFRFDLSVLTPVGAVFRLRAQYVRSMGSDFRFSMKKAPVSETTYLRPDGEASGAAGELMRHVGGENIDSNVNLYTDRPSPVAAIEISRRF